LKILDNWTDRIRRNYKFASKYHHGSGCDDSARSNLLKSIGGIREELSDQEISQVMLCMSIYQLTTNTTVPNKKDIKSIIIVNS